MSNLDNILNLIGANQRFLVVSHENPDCDALGSTIAMALVLRELGKDVIMYNKDGVPEHLRFLPECSGVADSLDRVTDGVEVIMLLDCADISRPGREFENLISNNDFTLAFVDHHASNGANSEYCLIDEKASSTGVILYRMIKRIGISISPEVAECLFSTIVGDTGSFRYSNTCSETFTIAAELVDHGADPEKISRFIYDNEPLRKVMLRTLAMNTLEVAGKIAFLHVSSEMLEQTGTEKEHTEGIVSMARSIEGIEVAVFLRQESALDWKVSLRSKEYVDVARIAGRYGGGGHRRAAGCVISAPLDTVKRRLLSSIEEAM
ncbi:MAG: bifunctional oligoribonuclease/PAP phosphatase NrnA [Candidatus Dadabacteria bacterium]|nr:bifunctional oligoribonuclease/PAP phosphatase NrnA [Candidatus Dadabacteria bacterium]